MNSHHSDAIVQSETSQTTAVNAATDRIPEATFYTPKDLATTWKLLAVTTVGNVLISSYFIPYLPLWMPLTWLAIALIAGGGQLWCSTRPVLQRWPYPRRLHIERGIFWLSQAGMGSAAYLLYVPDNLGMLGVLNVCVVVIGAMSVMQFSGDHWRGAVGAALAILPTATRYFFEDSWLLISLGLGGYIVVVALSMFGHVQYLALIEQAALRKRAEDASDAIAAVGLNKARFFAAVSHDLRQPVHAIGLYLAPLLESQQEGRAQKGVNGIYQSWQALDDLLSQVLDLTRMDSESLQAELTSVELAPLIKGLVIQHSAAAEKKAIRIVALVPSQKYVLADLLMLKRVLSNLLDNAIKFSPDDASIVIALRPSGTNWGLQVRDNGYGIALAMQSKVFEEFVQLDNPQRDRAQGLGLGLAIARRFVQLMQGQLLLRSARGMGTCMTVILPKIQIHDALFVNGTRRKISTATPTLPYTSLRVPAQLRQSLRDSGKAILLVEDDMLVAQAMMELFENLGLPTLHVSSAQAALQLAAKAAVAACDIRLPGGVTGLDLARRLHSLAIPALLMTGETSIEVNEAATRQDLILLIKPVKPQALLDGLGMLLASAT